MTQRHWVQNGRLMLITTNTSQRQPVFCDPALARTAVENIYRTQERFPFFLHAFVVMPDHCHFVITVPEDGFVSRIMHAYKRGVSFEIARGPLWQKRFDCRLINQPSAAINYVHNNPTTAGLCKFPEEYSWSSACGKWDICALDWSGGFA